MLSLDERLRNIELAIKQYPDLQSHLEILKATVEAQRELRTMSGKGFHTSLCNGDRVKKLQLKSEATGQPLIRLLKTSMMNEEVMLSATLRIVEAMIEHGTVT
ncbi:hypothetical protein KEJ51_02980, partial [Candidatus Bathyarchaeota archaeon]|nr:hypothetical protein [Candidatus Bathyarchaeota archaeon]